jgi:hypothetical protein
MSDSVTALRPSPGLTGLRPPPSGMPDPDLTPPAIAETGDPFTAVRVLDLVARLERGRPIRLSDVTDRLNATWLDWLFPVEVVVSVVLQLQANWMADYRNGSGIIVEDGPYGATLQIEDSSRVDPWIVRQARREATACEEQLAAFSRRDRVAGDG